MAPAQTVSVSQILLNPQRYIPRLFSTARFRLVSVVVLVLLIGSLFKAPSRLPEGGGRFSNGKLFTPVEVPARINRPKFNMAPTVLGGQVAPVETAAAASSPAGFQLPFTPQNFYSYDHEDKKWRSQTNTGAPVVDTLRSSVTLITWNVDFNSDEPEKRIEAAISYLRSVLVTSADDSDTLTPAVLLLQEVAAAMLRPITSNPWIRKNFFVTDITNGAWTNPSYGTLTLIDRRLQVSNVFRVKYTETRFGRDVLFTDITTNTPHEHETPKTLRIGNTHLESLMTPLRPGQVSVAAAYMRDTTIHASILAGDFNPIDPATDALIPQQNQMKDAWLEAGFDEADRKGFTWGLQSGHTGFPARRFDKILSWGKVRVELPTVIAQGSKVLSGRYFISDHFAVTGSVRVE